MKILLKSTQASSDPKGPNKLSLTKCQLRHFNGAKKSKNGIRLDLSAAAVNNIAKTGDIFSLLAAIPALIAAAATAVAKPAAFGAVETAAVMELKKAAGHGLWVNPG